MAVEYLKKAETDLRAVSRVESPDWRDGLELPVMVGVVDERGDTVVRVRIGTWVTEKRR